MPNLTVTRRAALASFAASVALAAAMPQSASARRALAPGRVTGGIHVDVTQLRENAGDPTAAWVERLLPGALAQALAARGAAGAPITARIQYVMLGPSSGGGGPAGSSPDQMVGEIVVGGVPHPLRAATWYYPSAPDQALVEQANFYRVQQLVNAFAFWAAQEV